MIRHHNIMTLNVSVILDRYHIVQCADKKHRQSSVMISPVPPKRHWIGMSSVAWNAMMTVPFPPDERLSFVG